MRLTVLMLSAAALTCHGGEYAVYRVFTTAPVNLVLPGDADRPAYCKSRRGQWVEAPTTAGERPHTVQVRLDPADLDAGRTRVVVNKPEWVVLDDNTPPAVVRVALDAQALADSGAEISLPALAPGSVLEMTVQDSANRIAADRGGGLLDAKPVALQVNPDPADPKRATLSLKVPSNLGFGRHQLVLRARDESPEANAVERRFAFVRFGVEIAGDGQSLRLHASGASFSCPGDDLGIISAPFIHRRDIRVCMNGKGGFLHTEGFKSRPTLVTDEPDRKVVRVQPALYLKDAKKPSTEFELVLDMEIRRDFPGLLVSSRATATAPFKKGYQFWSEFHSGPHYIGSDGRRVEWHARYAPIEPQGWIYLSPERPDDTGYGVATNGTLGEYLGNCLLLFTKPKQHPNMAAGDVIQIRFAVVPVTGPDEMAKGAEQIADWLKD